MAFTLVGLAQEDATLNIWNAANRTNEGAECVKGASLGVVDVDGSNLAGQTIKNATGSLHDRTTASTVVNSAMIEPGDGGFVFVRVKVINLTVDGIALHATASRTGVFQGFDVLEVNITGVTFKNTLTLYDQTAITTATCFTIGNQTGITGGRYLNNVIIIDADAGSVSGPSGTTAGMRMRNAANSFEEVSHFTMIDNSGKFANGISDDGAGLTITNRFNNIVGGFVTDYNLNTAVQPNRDNNQSSDATGTAGHRNISLAATFVSPTTSAELLSTAVAIGAGTDRTGVSGLATDNQGVARVVPVDIGALKFVAVDGAGGKTFSAGRSSSYGAAYAPTKYPQRWSRRRMAT